MIAWLRLVLNYWIIMKIQTFVIASHSTRWTDAVLRCYCSASSRLVYAQLDGLEKFILKIYSWPKVDCWFWGFKGLSDIQLFTSPWGAEEMWSFNETKNVCFSQSCFTCSYGLCLFVLYNSANWVTHIAITSSAVTIQMVLFSYQLECNHFFPWVFKCLLDFRSVQNEIWNPNFHRVTAAFRQRFFICIHVWFIPTVTMMCSRFFLSSTTLFF